VLLVIAHFVIEPVSIVCWLE